MEATPGRIDATADALAELLTFQAPADAVLRQWLRRHPRPGPRDRAFVADTAFAALRHLRRLESLTGGRDPRRLTLAALVRVGGAAVRAREPALRNGEAGWLAVLKGTPEPTSPAERLSLPDWLYERFVGAYGADGAETLATALLRAAPMDLRVNVLKASREEVLATLHTEGIEAEPTALALAGIRLRHKPFIERHPVFTGGLVEVQDEGSQLVAQLVDARRGQMVVDFCAGAGGKTLALGALMRSQGRLYAFDTSERRLANLTPRLRRSGLSNVHPQRIDSETDARVGRLRGKIDRVLVDVPCSGTGTLRRNPDLKWRMSPAALAELGAKQRAILASAARLLKPGGRLVYATCSLLPEENEAVVDDFLAASPGWRRLDAPQALRTAGLAVADSGEQDLRLDPARHGTDGFYAALLERSP
ncbi:MAG: RsmB/NOP family class I SAM-dependent RNA methyltransferase [Betaproteobacteria bacterium]